jgi:HSP20 family protein
MNQLREGFHPGGWGPWCGVLHPCVARGMQVVIGTRPIENHPPVQPRVAGCEKEYLMPEVKVTKELAKPEGMPVPYSEIFSPTLSFGKLFGLSPFALMREFTNEMDRVFKGIVPLSTGAFAPAIDVKVAEGVLLVTADVPGLKKEDVKIEVTDKALVIEGERKTEEKEDKPGFHKVERSYGKFYREIPLPEGAKIEMAKADLTNGVLTISLPVPEVVRKGRPVPIEEGGKIKTKAA